MVLVKLKWNKLTFDSVEINPDDGVDTLKRKVFELTGVPATRQKLMAKNAWTGTLKDDADLSTIKLTPNQQILLMGNADTLAAPVKPVTFVEDMTSEQKALTGVSLPAGLINMGNTCYMNATVQCLRYMKDLREVLQPVQAINTNSSVVLTNAFKNTLNQLDSSSTSITPMLFVQLLRAHFPQLAQIQNGQYMQQDAEEFFNILSSELNNGLSTFHSNFDSMLSFQMEETLTCQETDSEIPVIRTEKVTKLICNIQGTVGNGSSSTQQIDHLQDGVRLGLEGSLEKQSSILNRNALWKKHQRLATLPKFLCIHFMRFFWKPTPESRDHTGLKCKILRPVTYPDVLDIYDFCNDKLKEKLRFNRQEAEKKTKVTTDSDSAMVVEDSTNTTTTSTTTTAVADTTKKESSSSNNDSSNVGMGIDDETLEAMLADAGDEDEREALRAALLMSVHEGSASTTGTNTTTNNTTTTTATNKTTPSQSSGAFKDDSSGLPADFTGHYELHSIVTHKGRSADSGHYIGWVRQAPGSEYWWKFDDDVITEVNMTEIMNLKGGGDRDISYLAFYRFKSEST